MEDTQSDTSSKSGQEQTFAQKASEILTTIIFLMDVA